MKIHLNQIRSDGLHIEGEEDSKVLELADKITSPLTPISYALDIGVSEGGLFATGTLSCDFEMECGACLEKFRFPLEIDDFAMQTELEGSETVDLTPFIREDILLALPPYPRCDWNGEKTCAGARPVEQSDLPQEARDAWGELEKLKPKKTK